MSLPIWQPVIIHIWDSDISPRDVDRFHEIYLLFGDWDCGFCCYGSFLKTIYTEVNYRFRCGLLCFAEIDDNSIFRNLISPNPIGTVFNKQINEFARRLPEKCHSTAKT